MSGYNEKKALPVVTPSEFFQVSFSHKFSNFNLKMALRKYYLQSYCGPDPLTAQDRQIEIDARFYLFVETDVPGINER